MMKTKIGINSNKQRLALFFCIFFLAAALVLWVPWAQAQGSDAKSILKSMADYYVNGQKVAEGRIERTQPMVFSADETADVGIDLATPVVEAIGSESKSKFTGRIPKVTVEVKEMKKAEMKEENKARAEYAHKKALSD